jgi:hypothetical protein
MVKKEKNMIEKGLEELEAIEGSIMKWTNIVEEMKSGSDFPNENGYEDCPLCQLYHPINIGKSMTRGCSSFCPIKKDTGMDFCKGSPYAEWSKYCGETLKNAQAMLDYLIGLRDQVIKEIYSNRKSS